MRAGAARVALALAAAVLATCAGPKVRRSTIKMAERHATLTNGIRVILLPDETTDLVEVDVRYEVGSNEDPTGKEGLAHLVEHLMFQQRLAGDDRPPIGAALREMAIYVNAYTTHDSTHFQTLARKEAFEQIIGLEAARHHAGCAAISEAEFAREREVVRNEMRWRRGQLSEALTRELRRAIYPAPHPYRHDAGGDDESIASLTLADSCRFMKYFYVPERMTVVVAGNIDEAAVRRAVGAWLEPLASRSAAERQPVEGIPTDDRWTSAELDIDETVMFVAWPLPAEFTVESGAAASLTEILELAFAQEDEKNSVTKEHTVFQMGGPLAPALVLGMVVEDGVEPKAVLARVDGAVARLGHWTDNFADYVQNFDRVRTQLRASLALQMESLGARANAFADYAQFDPQQRFFSGAWSRIGGLTEEKVRDVSQDVLARRAAVLWIKPKPGARGKGRAALEFRRGEAEEPVVAIDPSAAEKPVDIPAKPTVHSRANRFELDNGMEVILLALPSNIPAVSAALVYRVGSAHEPRNREGLALMAAAVLERRASSYFAGDWSVSFDHTVRWRHALNANLHELLEELALRETTLDEDKAILDGWRRFLTERWKERDVRSRATFGLHMARALYGENHPYAIVGRATPESLDLIEPKEIVDWQERYFTASNATLVIAGNFDALEAANHIRRLFGKWPAGDAARPITDPARPRNEAVAFGLADPDASVVHVALGFPTEPGIGQDPASRLILTEMMDRRAQTLRDQLGVAYTVEADLEARVGPSIYFLAGSVDSPRAGESLAALRTAVQGMASAPDFAATFALARQSVLRRLLGGATNSAALRDQLIELAIHRLPVDHYDQLVQNVATATPGQVQAAITRELRADREVIGAVAPRDVLQQMFQSANVPRAAIIE